MTPCRSAELSVGALRTASAGSPPAQRRLVEALDPATGGVSGRRYQVDEESPHAAECQVIRVARLEVTRLVLWGTTSGTPASRRQVDLGGDAVEEQRSRRAASGLQSSMHAGGGAVRRGLADLGGWLVQQHPVS